MKGKLQTDTNREDTHLSALHFSGRRYKLVRTAVIISIKNSKSKCAVQHESSLNTALCLRCELQGCELFQCAYSKITSAILR